MAKKIVFTLLLCIGSLISVSAAAAKEVTTCEGDLNKLRLYNVMLGRAPDAKGGMDWLKRGSSLKETARLFETSREFRQKHSTKSDAAYVDWFYDEVLEREGDAPGVRTWTKKISEEGRASVAAEWARSKEVINKYPYTRSSFCKYAGTHGATEVAPGIASRKSGQTVIAFADGITATIDTVHTPRRLTSPILRYQKDYDLVVNANWFDPNTGKVIGPLVSNGKNLGGKDDATKGFIGEKTDGTPFSIFHGATQEPPSDTRTGASGIHIVHQGKSMEHIFDGSYTFTTKKHSAMGYTDEGYWIFVTSYEKNANELANLMLRLGATEAIMLDGGGSTQMAVKGSPSLYSFLFQRPVTSHVVVESTDTNLFAPG